MSIVAVFALRFQNLPARNSSLKIFKHEKEEKLAGPKGKLAGPAQFLVASGQRLMRRLLLKIQSGHDSVHRQTDRQGKTSIPPFQLR